MEIGVAHESVSSGFGESYDKDGGFCTPINHSAQAVYKEENKQRIPNILNLKTKKKSFLELNKNSQHSKPHIHKVDDGYAKNKNYTEEYKTGVASNSIKTHKS